MMKTSRPDGITRYLLRRLRAGNQNRRRQHWRLLRMLARQ